MRTRLVFSGWLLLSTTIRRRPPAAGASEFARVGFVRYPFQFPSDASGKIDGGNGVSSFPITTASAEAQAFFNQGISQLHSFWARESEKSFMQAAQLDPNAAMAYWGIAMSAAGGLPAGLPAPARPIPAEPASGRTQRGTGARGGGDQEGDGTP